jgi:hypothetical protein
MNDTKLKWWKKEMPSGLEPAAEGALWGFLLAWGLLILGAFILGMYIFTPLIGYFDIPVFPILWLFAHLILSKSWGPHMNWILAHFISWILGGIIYAYIFHAVRLRYSQRKSEKAPKSNTE